MAGKVSLPPSLSRTPSRQASDENERKQEARERAVMTAMRALPLIETANSQVLRGFVSAFEMTYYAVERKQREAGASPGTVKKQLNLMADKCSKLAKYLKKMHRDAIHEWGRAAGVGGLISIWQLSQILDESASHAEQAFKAFKADQRAEGKGGNPGDPMATAMTETAAFVYSKLTVKQRY